MNPHDDPTEPTDPANPYSTPRSGVERGEGVQAPQPLAGLMQRLAGAVVDTTLLWSCLLGPILLAGDWPSISEALQSGDPKRVSQVLEGATYTATPILLLTLAAFNMYLLHRDGQTIGKRMLGTRIVRTSGQRAHLLRIVALRVLLPGLIFNIPLVGILSVLFGHAIILLKPRRCLHDYLADTKVVRV